ncbi:Ig-like domain-containing protein [Clostridium sp. CH2]|uniref:Ig-like domain-containing protein n=1 Tax=Clostridium sp. CH2 TaxID=2949990 RepID=UPI00207AEB1F|nr:Ig-like domain-containing protein [Clostridium sp. CH2]
MTGVEGGEVSDDNSDVSVKVTVNVRWTFTAAIDPDDVDVAHFIISKVSDGSIVKGSLTINGKYDVVTFIPDGIEAATKYNATAKSCDLLSGTGTTSPISVDFTTL